MKKVLFLIHDLGGGGAEKVLVNLVNNLDSTKFDITVMTLFDIGINRQYLAPHIRYQSIHKYMMPGNSHFMKLLTPKRLHNMYIKDEYDIEIAYLEGPSSRVISGCCNSNVKLVSWIHGEQFDRKVAAASFRNAKEADECYNHFNKMVYVSSTVKDDFEKLIHLEREGIVLYNTVESEQIMSLSKDKVDEIIDDGSIRIVSMGTLKKVKGFERLLGIIKRLQNEHYRIHLYLLGKGPLQNELEQFVSANNLNDCVTFLGYHTNPYKYVSKCDLFVCSSYREGFSTAVTEALIVGTPVCTTEVSGMKEMLGDHNEFGIITDNNEDALFEGIKLLLDNPDLLTHYRKKALERGKQFCKEKTVQAVEEMLLSL